MARSFIDGFTNDCAYGEASICEFASLCDFVAATIFVLALVPQLHKNSYIKSVVGLSILWATAHFTGMLVYCFYSFESRRNIYFKITSILYCVTSFGILVQFWIYTKQNIKFKMTFSGSCIIIWGAIVTLELAVPKPRGSYKMEWIGVFLLSVELLPQVMLNIMKRSTCSQSNIAVALSTLAKSFSYVAGHFLVMSVEFRIMAYFAAFIGHINCFQLIWYRRPIYYKRRVQRYSLESAETFIEPRSFELTNEKEIVPADGIMDGETINPQEVSPITVNGEMYFPSYICRFRRMKIWEILVCVYVIMALLCLTVVSCFIIKSGFMLFAPLLVLVFIFFTTFYRDYQEGRFHCCYNTCDHMHDKIFSDIKVKNIIVR